MLALILKAIALYRLKYSRKILSDCKYKPTCSRYAYSAFRRLGLMRGFFKTFIRLAKCAPWGVGGLDPRPNRSWLERGE